MPSKHNHDRPLIPLCFVLMPFGKKSDRGVRVIDFDRVYSEIIAPAIIRAGMDPIRADEEQTGGIIHKAMFERLMLCDYAIADLTTANANVFYELGIRHGIRPQSTILIHGATMNLPFDVAPLRSLSYHLDFEGNPAKPKDDCEHLAKLLEQCRNPVADSPLFQLISDFPPPDIARLRTDLFRDRVAYAQGCKERLAIARKEGEPAVAAFENEINLREAEPAIIIDLFLSYRAVSAWQRMVELVERMPGPVANAVLVREQLGLALNRLGRRDEAERVLRQVIETHGPSSETNGILGRVFKDRWDEAVKTGKKAVADGFLRQAIETYLAGFEADWRDAYPGINAVTLMEMANPVDARQGALLPVVGYAVKRRLSGKRPDYWDHATLLELHVLGRDRAAAEVALADALATVRESFEPQTTARNLSLIRRAREDRGEDQEWVRSIERELEGVRF
ncbi:MAG: DUF4071 domain-containing protein [Magnetococcales bacterium]|nr:DUF4071 domain-containing protein [Magnetococcales bacterium]